MEVPERPVGQACLDSAGVSIWNGLPIVITCRIVCGATRASSASEDATETPPDDIDRAVLLVEFVDALDDAVEDLWRGPRLRPRSQP